MMRRGINLLRCGATSRSPARF